LLMAFLLRLEAAQLLLVAQLLGGLGRRRGRRLALAALPHGGGMRGQPAKAERRNAGRQKRSVHALLGSITGPLSTLAPPESTRRSTSAIFGPPPETDFLLRSSRFSL
jgi:hypothetical protein